LVDLTGAPAVVRIELPQDLIHEPPEAGSALRRAGVEVAEVVDGGDYFPTNGEGSALAVQQPVQVALDRFPLVDQVWVSVLPVDDRRDLGHVALLPPRGGRSGSSCLFRHYRWRRGSSTGPGRQMSPAIRPQCQPSSVAKLLPNRFATPL